MLFNLCNCAAERERHLRIVAGVSDGVADDPSLVKLPAGALMFPNPVPAALSPCWIYVDGLWFWNPLACPL